MTRRVGIELSPSRCALIDVEVSRDAGAAEPTEVRSFRTFAWNADDPSDLALTLRTLRESNSLGPGAVVVCWGSDSSDSSACVAPVAAAGFDIEKVISPPVALAGLSRLFPAFAEDHVAYLAVNRDATALAVVHRSALALGREIPVVAHRTASGEGEPARAGSDALDFARRLAPELRRSFLALKQQARAGVNRLVICGDFPNLRSLTAPLMHSLSVDVAVLDGTQGIAVRGRGPLDAAMIRERAAQMRVAWAAATDRAPSPDDGRPPATPPSRAAAGDHRALIAGAVALLVLVVGLTWFAARRWRGDDADTYALRRAVARVESQVRNLERTRSQSGSAVSTPPPAAETPTPRTSSPAGPPPTRRSVSPPATLRASARPPTVRSILFSSDRRFALIGPRIVGVGDRVDKDVIVAIEPKAVVFRTPSGELRRVEVTREAAPGPAAGPRTE